jgi:hypothetical protein
VQLNTGAMQGVHRLSEVQGCEPEQRVEGLLLQVCAESKGFNTWRLLNVCRKECVQGSLKIQSYKKLRKDKAFEFVEGQ